MKEVSGDQLLLGKGKVYFDRKDADGNLVGERFLGNCTQLQIGTEDELREKYSSATASAPLLKRVNVRRTQEFTLTLDHFNKENIALALMGDVSALTQGSGSVTDEVIGAVQQGRYYKTSYRNISTVTVEPSGGGEAYTLNTDYTIDAVTGRIYIVEGGGIADDDEIQVDYDYAEDTSVVVRSGVSNTIEGFMRFVGDPSTGPALEVEVWDVSINPDGVLDLISDEYAEFSLKGAVQDDSANHPDEPYFRVIVRS